MSTPDEKATEAFRSVATKWNLDDILLYVRDQKPDHKVTDAGLAVILTRFNTQKSADKKSPTGERREFEPYDMDSRTKKGFDLVIAIAQHKAISVTTLEMVKAFYIIYKDVLLDYDTKFTQIYAHRIKEAYKGGNVRALTKRKIEHELQARF
ncbi:MAG: hypothetical protein KU37_02625 [Sulfuricurvum sp. PC08-66]|nr:MAG: hypothetical protein KU37_02625 [Sulfuricurvum sp. PC08-66]